MRKRVALSPLMRGMLQRLADGMAMDKAPPPSLQHAAGVAYVEPEGRALFLRRAEDGDHPGEWCFPGGGIDEGETAEDAAMRESKEELGALPYGERSPMAETHHDGVHFTTFKQPIARAFTPKLNHEHSEHTWAPLSEPPEPLHPGVRAAIGSALAMDGWLAMDDWSESDHKRADNGQFGSGGGGAIALKSKSKVREFGEPTHTRVELSNGATHRIQKLGSRESMGLPGWHDIDQDEHSYLDETEDAAVKKLIEQHQGRADRAASGKAIADLFANSLGKKRADMPQVPKGVKEEFLRELREKTTVTHEKVDARSLKPTQGDYKADQIEAFAKAGIDPDKGTIMVSSDGYVLDGHHRWAAAALNGTKLSTIKVGMPIKELLATAEDFNKRAGVERRTAEDSDVVGDAWVETDHTRANNGQFGSGGSGGAATAPAAEPHATANSEAPAPGAQSFLPPALYDEAKRTIALWSQADAPGRKLTPEEKAKATDELAESLEAAHAAKPDYDKRVTEIAKSLGAKVMLAGIKGGERLLEKHVTENESIASNMKDLVRGSIIVNSINDVPAAIEAIGKNFVIARTKDRFAKPEDTGYRDVLINVKLPGGVLGEVQIHIPEMMATKNDIGHALYNIERKQPEGSALKAQLKELQTRVYGAAHQSHLDTLSKRLKPVRSHSPNSAEDSVDPSIPAFCSLGYGRDSPDLRLNAKQRPVGSSTTGIESTSRNLDPAGMSDRFIAGAPFDDILRLAKDDDHWITVHGGGGKGQPLLITGGGVVVGGAGGSMNGMRLDPKSKSAARPSSPTAISKSANIAKSLQNRNRSSAASISQMNKIASNPNPRLLMSSPTMADGAPVVSDLAGHGIGSLKDEAPGSPPPKPGEPFIVYRFGSGGDLANANGGNANAVGLYLARFDDGDLPQNVGAERSNKVTAYRVVIDKPFGKYEGGSGGRQMNGGDVGRVDSPHHGISYSFPKGGGWHAEEVGSVDLDDLRAHAKKTVGYDNFDDMGGNKAAEAIRSSMTKAGEKMASDEAMFVAQRSTRGLAFDRGTVRTIDVDGRMHVAVTNISKAAVNGYLGKEIPGFEELGLDPKRIYKLFRDPAELKKGAATFNGIPLLSAHVAVSADDHKPALVVGASGTDAEFVHPFLKNSLVIWSQDAIDGVESGEQRELSCAYRYRPVMEPGIFEGERYDGRMTELVGNHIALVESGRAGPDVVVGDSQLKKEHAMKSKPLSRHALLAKGALLGSVSPLLAADSRLDLNVLLAGVTGSNWLTKKPGILAAIKPRLARDADMSHVVKMLDSLDGEKGAPGADDPEKPEAGSGGGPEPTDPGVIDDADPVEDILGMLRGKLSDEDLAAVGEKIKGLLTPAADADPADPGDPTLVPKPGDEPKDPPMLEKAGGAMDSATVGRLVAKSVAEASEAARKQAREAAEAREVVRPFVGQVSVALDSGEQVYKAALELLGVKVEGVPPAAFRHILEAQPKGGARETSAIAQDSAAAATDDFYARFPGMKPA